MAYIDVAKQETSDEINSKIGMADDTGGSESEETVMGKLNKLISAPQVINSIQRGSLTTASSSTTVTIDLSIIDPDKSFVILNGAFRDDASATVQSLTATQLIIAVNSSGMTPISWQVIEFC